MFPILGIIMNILGMNMVDLKEAVQDKGAWEVLFHRVAEGQTRLNG